MNDPGRAAAALLACALLALGGCAMQQADALLAHPPAELPDYVELAPVPYFPQEDQQCAPAALATVLAYEGVEITPEALSEQLGVPEGEGSMQAGMLAAIRRHGLVAYRLNPGLQDLLREVSGGNPVVVLENLSLPLYPSWRYAVVVGYDLPARALLLRSGRSFRMKMALGEFERAWARSGYWALLALPPDQLPASGDAERYAGAAMALERVSPAAARRAYATALQRWPHDLSARLGLGNTAYAAGDLPAAEAAYRSALRDHPEAADAWNGLARTLYRLHRKDQALAAAERAVALGGPRQAQYRETRQTIMRGD
ncbi:MAG TPA: PA2778 family cysteine peptidase [Burkholderiales bacterium]|nr:PA2778 family cysteine peptidase [Burkholderiales bacterium]